MAGDWHMIRLDLHEDPAVIAIAELLDLDEDTVVGKLHRLWAWANQQTEDGHAEGVTEKWVDRYIGHAGFAQSLQKAGWIELQNDCITFPHFDRWMSDSAKKRGKARKRKAKQRHAKGGTKGGTKVGPKKRREEKKEETPIVPLVNGKGRGKAKDYPEAFKAWWEVYPKKSGKEFALTSWMKAVALICVRSDCTGDEGRQKLQDAAEQYAQSSTAKSKWCLNPATWLNQGHYDDDPATWEEKYGRQDESSARVRQRDVSGVDRHYRAPEDSGAAAKSEHSDADVSTDDGPSAT